MVVEFSGKKIWKGGGGRLNIQWVHKSSRDLAHGIANHEEKIQQRLFKRDQLKINRAFLQLIF